MLAKEVTAGIWLIFRR